MGGYKVGSLDFQQEPHFYQFPIRYKKTYSTYVAFIIPINRLHHPRHPHLTYTTKESYISVFSSAGGLMVRIGRCQRLDPGSIPGRRTIFFVIFVCKVVFILYMY